ncbi:MAG: hypothetical protein MJE66_20335 [Proteobacteria bacterium]|nr:hypothetical protein [Pseudomonadota bacterium]
MLFHERAYDVTVLLGDPAVDPLWTRSVWDLAEPNLRPLMTSARGRAALRSHQTDTSTKSDVRFGRIGWNPKGHAKWLHDNSERTDRWLFGSVEAWAPSWTVCERESRPPDAFLSISNEKAGRAFRRSARFNPVVVIALARDGDDLREPINAAIETIRRAISAVFVVQKCRPWGFAAGARGFKDSIQDFPHRLFAAGENPHEKVPSLEIFAESWMELGDAAG